MRPQRAEWDAHSSQILKAERSRVERIGDGCYNRPCSTTLPSVGRGSPDFCQGSGRGRL